VRAFALLSLVLSFGLAFPAHAKEFRHYFGMQWVLAPNPGQVGERLVAKGDTITTARVLTEDLFETRAPISVEGKVVLAAGAQLATAHSAKPVRCTVAAGEPGTLSAKRRICLVDWDADGRFERFFDVGLGQGGGDMQFTGCIPNDAARIEPVDMVALDPATLRNPMAMRVELKNIFGGKPKKGQSAEEARRFVSFEVGGSMGRNDRIWNYYRFCTRNGTSCRIPLGEPVTVARDGIAFIITDFDGQKAKVRLVQDFQNRPYYDMTRGNRPPAFYCPGTLFVETDEMTF
jgi:hypothetical protein